jgi:hypothetical protein
MDAQKFELSNDELSGEELDMVSGGLLGFLIEAVEAVAEAGAKYVYNHYK